MSPASVKSIGTQVGFVLTIAFSIVSASHASPVVLKDINTQPASSDPGEITVLGNTAFFTATAVQSGREVWISDGTAAGTMLLKDINPGTADANPHTFIVGNGLVYFSVLDGTTRQFYQSDGTGAGTIPAVPPLPPPPPDDTTLDLPNGTTLFVDPFSLAPGFDSVWRTDGTVPGTFELCCVEPTALREAGGLAFIANDGIPGVLNPPIPPMLVSTDGSTGSIVELLTQQVFELTAFGGTIYFAANDPTVGDELWTSDGSIGGTLVFADLNPGAAGSFPSGLGIAGSDIFFGAQDPSLGAELWKTNGTVAGTVLVKDINNGTPDSNPVTLGELAGNAFIAADDGVHGVEPWSSDGTAGGTNLVLDINTATSSSFPDFFTSDANLLMFAAAEDGTTSNRMLWVSDGSEAGTLALESFAPSIGFTTAIEFDGSLLFSVFHADLGAELWKTDGTVAGTVLLTGTSPGPLVDIPAEPIVVGDKVFFRVTGTNIGQELGVTDGTEAGTFVVKDISPGILSSTPTFFAALGDKAIFAASGQLWSSDGTEAQTVKVHPFIKPVSRIVVFDQFGYFFGDDAFGDDTAGAELWRTDGTEAGTTLVKDINPGFPGSAPSSANQVNMVVYDGALYFYALSRFWRSDGTAAGTTLVKDIAIGPVGAVGSTSIVIVNGIMYFAASDFLAERELWRSDGTEAGTYKVVDIRPFPGIPEIDNLTAVGDALYFTADDGVHGFELWVSDGTAAGTVLVEDIQPGAVSSFPRLLNELNGSLFFTASTGEFGWEVLRVSCGNGTLDSGEECDDGNNQSGDCCSPICTFQTGACSDNGCSSGTCNAGVCEATASLCDAILGRSFSATDRATGIGKRRVEVSAVSASGASTLSGDPVANGATLEVETDGANPTTQTFAIPGGLAVAGGAGWKQLGSRGYQYKDRNGTSGPVRRISITQSSSGKTRIRASIRGNGLDIVPPDPGTEGHVRVLIPSGSNYCANFGGTAGGLVSNKGSRSFKIKRPTNATACD